MHINKRVGIFRIQNHGVVRCAHNSALFPFAAQVSAFHGEGEVSWLKAETCELQHNVLIDSVTRLMSANGHNRISVQDYTVASIDERECPTRVLRVTVGY